MSMELNLGRDGRVAGRVLERWGSDVAGSMAGYHRTEPFQIAVAMLTLSCSTSECFGASRDGVEQRM